MSRRSHASRKCLAGATAALACSALAAFGDASTVAASGPGSTGSSPARLHPATAVERGEAATIARYWTAERMRSTPPLATAKLPGNPFATVSFGPVATPTVAPFSVNGRLFVRQGGRRGFCSATAINSGSRRLVLTAGHCVNSGPLGPRGGSIWSRFVEFVPAYTNGTAPFGAFIARRNAVFAPRQWVRFGNPNFDVGAVLTSPNAEGINVADAVGGAAIVVDQSRRQTFQTFGYPGKATTMQGCESPYVGDDPLTYRIPGPPTIAIRCHWARGASGGGWLTAGGTTINGLTSYGKRTDRIHTFSPYFSVRNVGRLVAGL
jgi:V8-like Glu-specific endopeptidase